jgi:hypothetical protein
VLSVRGEIDFPIHVFANVGDDSENPGTLTYVRDVLKPYASKHGLTFHEASRDGETLYQRVTRPGQKGIQIPLRGMNGRPMARNCTFDFKVSVIHDYLKRHGATAENPATTGIGISIDEIERAGRGTDRLIERRTYPLLELGLHRRDCYRIIADAGLPTPPKSSCWFCPFHSRQSWREMRRDQPEIFASAVQLESMLLTRQRLAGRDPLYLSSAALPLDIAITEAQAPLFAEGIETCDGGVCFT